MNNTRCTICIRREDKNKWEKRTPLIPSHAKYLKKKYGVKICVQPSQIRIFKDSDYSDNEIELVNDMNHCSIILALKEIPEELIMKDKIYLFFSHTAKGQSRNMPMLKKLKQQKCTLIDYEKITDRKGRRLIFFGTQAGQSGMIETLCALGKRLDTEGIPNPFSQIKQPFQYTHLGEAKKHIKKIGAVIKEKGLVSGIVPFVCGFSGYGHTSKGAQEIFDILPHKEVDAEDLDAFMNSSGHKNNRLYKVVFKEVDMVEPKDNKNPFDLLDYYKNPEKYRSRFSKYLKHLTLLINCIYWEPKYPKFIKYSDLKALFQAQTNPRLRIIGDISCDIEGSIECTQYSTTPENPTYLFDPIEGKIKSNEQGRGIAVMSIDNLPAEIPLESSVFFSKTLKTFIPQIDHADYSVEFDKCELPEPIKKAVILYKGEFTTNFKYMEEYIKGNHNE